jgi:multidrug resistance efflux pump
MAILKRQINTRRRPVKVKLLGYRQLVRGEVDSVARGITVANAQPDQQGLATVNPIFTWVRLAQRVPVRVRITEVPDDVRLVASMTATSEIALESIIFRHVRVSALH